MLILTTIFLSSIILVEYNYAFQYIYYALPISHNIVVTVFLILRTISCSLTAVTQVGECLECQTLGSSTP